MEENQATATSPMPTKSITSAETNPQKGSKTLIILIILLTTLAVAGYGIYTYNKVQNDESDTSEDQKDTNADEETNIEQSEDDSDPIPTEEDGVGTTYDYSTWTTINNPFGYYVSYPNNPLPENIENLDCTELSFGDFTVMLISIDNSDSIDCKRTGFGAGDLVHEDYTFTTKEGAYFSGTKEIFTSIDPSDPQLPNEEYYYLNGTLSGGRNLHVEFGYKTSEKDTYLPIFEQILYSLK